MSPVLLYEQMYVCVALIVDEDIAATDETDAAAGVMLC